MSGNTRWLWYLGHAVLCALSVFLFHALIVKLYRDQPLHLSVWLALAFGVALGLRELARGTNPDTRNRLQRFWAAIDEVDIAFMALFCVLLVVFNAGYLRATADGRHYFVHLRSMVIDFDLDFANENASFRTEMPQIFPFGSAVLWAPFFIAAHLWFGLLNLLGGEFPRNGFANPYQMAVGLGTVIYGFAGLYIAYLFARDYYPKRTAAVATTFVASASFIVWYLAVESSYTHGNSLFTVTLFLFLWHRSRDQRSLRQWAWLGLAAGVMTMVRWQNAVFLLFPLVDGVADVFRAAFGSRSTTWKSVLSEAASFTATFVIGAFPQLVFWKVVNGGWFALPHGQSGQQWWGDSLVVDILFSSNHGLFAWHPVLYFAVLGVPLFLLRDPRLGSLLTLIFVMQIYVNGAVATWWGGHSFGGRRFASCALLFILGLAALLQWAQKRPLTSLSAVLVVFTLANASFMLDIKQGALPTSEGVGVNQVLAGAYRRVGNPFSFPANWVFWRRYGIEPWQYDQLGLRMFNNLSLDLGSDSSSRFLGHGWWGPEGGPGGFRWAVGRESVLVVPLKAVTFVEPGEPLEQADYVLTVDAQPFRYDGAPPQSLEVWVNGRLAGRQRLADEARRYAIDIPRELLGRNLNIIRFRYAYAQAPIELGGNQDERELAVRFDAIEFRRLPQ